MNKRFYQQSVYSQCLALEARLVFDGAVVATAVEVQNTTNDETSAEAVDVTVTALSASEPVPEQTPPEFLAAINLPNWLETAFITEAGTEKITTLVVVDPRVDNAALLTTNPPPLKDSSSATNLVFIDGVVQDVANIVSAVDENTEIIYLDATKDGLMQIADYLEGRSGIDSIQIISHGKNATLYLGNDVLTNDNLTSHAEQLASIGQSLTLNGDVLLYGCELAKSAEGTQFVDMFSYLTNADVAASTDHTGAVSKGGNWTLEYTTGTIEASVLAASHYQAILALPSFDVAGLPLLFKNPVAQKGTGVNTGDVVLFSNVVTVNGQAIDAVVTIVNNDGISISNLDTLNGTPLPAGLSINDNWFELITQPTVVNGASTIKFEFIKSATYNVIAGIGDGVLLQNVVVNSYDIDNGQFQDFSGFSSYTVASNTSLAQSTLGNFVHFSDTTNVDNPETPTSNLAVFNQARVTAYYKEINAFQIKTGSINTADPAYFYLDFSSGPTLTAPISYDIPTVNPLTTHSFTPTITGTYAPKVTGSSDTAQSLTVTVNGVDYTSSNGLTWGVVVGTWSLTLPTTPAGTYDVVVDTGYGPTINAHTKDITLNELVIINDPPVNTAPNSQTVTVGVATTIPNLSVTDVNGNLATTELTVTSGVITVDLAGGATISSGINGTATLTLSGTEAEIKAALATVSYTANIGTNNDGLIIRSTDSVGLIDTDTVTITVNNAPVNTAPTAVNDTATGVTGVATTVNVVGNDTDPENNLNPATVKIVGTANAGDSFVVAGQGTWTVNAITGAITFTPIAGFTGNPTPISYTVQDNTGLMSNPATVAVKLNNLPIAVPDSNTTTEGGSAITDNVIANDANLGDKPAIVSSASQGANPINIGSTFITAAGGILILNNNGSYSYTPPLSNIPLDGLVETFTYTIMDSNGDISSSVLTILVSSVSGTSGSLIQLSNPSTQIAVDTPPLFVATPVNIVTVLDLSLYIPSLEGIISLTGSLRDQVVLELAPFSFHIPRWYFSHTNPNEQLEFDATYPDGRALPDWLKFNHSQLKFSGIPPKGAHNETIMVTVRDTYGNEAHAMFTVHVNQERLRPEHKPFKIDVKLAGLSKEIENQLSEKLTGIGKTGLSERIHTVGKLGKLQESFMLLDSLKDL